MTKVPIHPPVAAWPLLIPAALLDGVFVVGLIILQAKTFINASGKITELTLMTQEFASTAVSTDQLNQLMLDNAKFQALYNEVLVGILATLLGAFVLWVIFRGIATYLNHRMAGGKYPLGRYLSKHALLSLFWGAFLLLLLVISVRLTAAAFSPLPLLSERRASTVTFGLLAVLGYFAGISYALIPLKRTLRTALKLAASRAAKRLVPRYIAGLALLAVLGLNVLFFFRIHPLAGGAAFLLLFLPGISFARLLLHPAALAAAKKA